MERTGCPYQPRSRDSILTVRSLSLFDDPVNWYNAMLLSFATQCSSRRSLVLAICLVYELCSYITTSMISYRHISVCCNIHCVHQKVNKILTLKVVNKFLSKLASSIIGKGLTTGHKNYSLYLVGYMHGH